MVNSQIFKCDKRILTIRVTIHNDHTPQFPNTKSRNFVPFLEILFSVQNAPLDNPIDTFIEQRHGGGGLNNISQWTQEFASQPWL